MYMEVMKMPRQARLILDDVCYHIITRGNEGKTVFEGENDFEKYLSLLLKYKRRYDFKLYGWCLMTNHVHLVVESDKLSKVMHGINLSYAQYFHTLYSSSGHFWHDRYKSYVIQKDEYLVNCITYVEHNPVRANIVRRPDHYKWSSYEARILGKANGLLDTIVL